MALAALTERQSPAERAAHYQLAVAQVTRWKLRIREQAAQTFTETPAILVLAPNVELLSAASGRLQMENALLKKCRPDVHCLVTCPGSSAGPGRQLGSRPLPGPGPQQRLLSALRRKCVHLGPDAPA